MEIEVDGRMYTDYKDTYGHGQRRVGRVQEFLKCKEGGHLLAHEALTEEGLCPHCGTTAYASRLLTPQDVPEEVLERFGITIDSDGFEQDTLI